MPAAMMAETQSARRLAGAEAEQHRACGLGRAQDAHGGLGGDAELALRADRKAHQVVAGRIKVRPADVHDLAVHQDEAHAQHVVGGDAVLEAVRAAGVHAEVAGQRAGELARRVGGVEEAVRLDGLADAEVGDAGLDAGGTVHGVDVEHAVHARHADHQGVLGGQRPAGQRGAGAAGHHLDVVGVAVAEQPRHLLGGGGQGHGQRHAAVGGERVGLERASALLVGDDGAGGHELLQIGDDGCALAHGRAIRFRQRQCHGFPVPSLPRVA